MYNALFRRTTVRKAEVERVEHDIAILRASSLLDPIWYREQYLDLTNNPVDVARHYVLHGEREGRAPHLLFDSHYYLNKYQDVAASGFNAFAHFLEYGGTEDRNPHPLFDSRYYRRKYAIPSRINPLDHFWRSCSPSDLQQCHPLFDPRWYLDTYPDARGFSGHPLVHFILYGAKEGRDPCALFSVSYYMDKYGEYLCDEPNALIQYLTVGWKLGNNPHPGFDVQKYLKRYQDVKNAGTEPLSHYLSSGRDEGRIAFTTDEFAVNSLSHEVKELTKEKRRHNKELAILRRTNQHLEFIFDEATKVISSAERERDVLISTFENLFGRDSILPLVSKIRDEFDVELIRTSKFFDAEWYLSKYPEVETSKTDPWLHFKLHGFYDGCDPSAFFSLAKYTERRPDLKTDNANLLVHFLRSGLSKDRDFFRVIPNDNADNDSILDVTRKSKVAVFVSHDANVGGAPAVLLEIVRWFQLHTDFEIFVVCMTGGPWADEFRNIAATHVIGETRPAKQTCREYSRQLRDFVGREPSFVFLNSVASGGFLDINPFDAPVFAYVHELTKLLALFSEFSEAIAAKASHIFCAGPLAAMAFGEITGADKKISNRPPFIAQQRLHKFLSSTEKEDLRESFGWSRRTKIVAGCGTVHWRKQPDAFVRIAKRFFDGGDADVKFIWIGGGEDIAEIRDQICSLNLAEKVEFIGHQKREDVEKYLKMSDLFALTSLEDPFPLVCLEAAAVSTPSVIFSDGTGITNFVAPAGLPAAGVAVAKFDEAVFATVLRNLLFEENARKELARIGRARIAEEYSTDAACRDILRRLRATGDIAPRVSVIVPNFNCAPYLAERLNSIAAQTFRDYEILLLDDQSTDNGNEILSEFSLRNADAIFVRSDVNSGSPFLAWERGVRLAKGDLVWIAEADDFCEPDLLTQLVSRFAVPGVKLAYGRSVPVSINGSISGDYNSLYLNRISAGRWDRSYVECSHVEVKAALGKGNSIPNASAVVVRRQSALRAIDFAKQFRLAGDWAFYVTAIAGGKIAYVHEATNYHRRHEGTVTHSLEGGHLYFQELVDVGEIIKAFYNVDADRDSQLTAFIKQEALRFSFSDDIPRPRDLFKDHSPPPPGLLYAIGDLGAGGAQLFAVRLVNEWAERGAPVVLFSAEYERSVSATLAALSPEVELVTREDVEVEGISAFMRRRNLRCVLSGHWWGDVQIGKWIENDGARIPWAIVLHGCYENVLSHSEHFPNMQEEFGRAERHCDFWIWTAPKNKRVFEEGWIKPKRLRQIVNGFRAVAPMRDLRATFTTEKNAMIFTLASRAIEEKGWRVAYEAFQSVRSRNSDKTVILLLIGSGPLSDEYSAFSGSNGVFVIPHTKHLADYIAASDVCLLPSWFSGESLPLTVIEFLAQGKPAIVSDIGMCPWAIDEGADDGTSGIVVARNVKTGAVDSNDLAKAMECFLLDEEFAKSARKFAIKAFGKFDMDKMIDQYSEILCEIIK